MSVHDHLRRHEGNPPDDNWKSYPSDGLPGNHNRSRSRSSSPSPRDHGSSRQPMHFHGQNSPPVFPDSPQTAVDLSKTSRDSSFALDSRRPSAHVPHTITSSQSCSSPPRHSNGLSPPMRTDSVESNPFYNGVMDPSLHSPPGLMPTMVHMPFSHVGMDIMPMSPMAPLSMGGYLNSRKRRAENRESRESREKEREKESEAAKTSDEEKKLAKPVPDEKKDDAYWERRRKNNEAAKRSRDARRQKEEEIAMRAAFLEQENLKLRAQVTILRAENTKLHYMIFNRH